MLFEIIGVVWEGPWNIEFDAVMFWGLNNDNVDNWYNYIYWEIKFYEKEVYKW